MIGSMNLKHFPNATVLFVLVLVRAAIAFNPSHRHFEWTRQTISRGRCYRSNSHLNLSNDDGDDGWGDDGVVDSSTLEDKTKELRQLQQAAFSRSSRQARSTEEPERDFFIPIVAVVSLMGLFGSYGYEMVRLASRGELYLPWN
jgi:hypothetical protein